MKYKLIIFDLDGTILNTLEDLTDSTNYALVKHDFPQRTIEEVRHFVGNGIAKLIERAVPTGTDGEKTKRVLTDFTAYYGAHCADKTRAYEGVTELISDLRRVGYLTAVVSNKADFAVQELCKQYFPGLFDYVVGEQENIRRKPAPDTALEVINRLHVDKKEALYIGDSDVDIQTAANAGMEEIAVTWGFRDKVFLLEKGATKTVDTVQELWNLLS